MSAAQGFLLDNPKEESYIELTAQVLWSSIFGLIIRIIIEDRYK